MFVRRCAGVVFGDLSVMSERERERKHYPRIRSVDSCHPVGEECKEFLFDSRVKQGNLFSLVEVWLQRPPFPNTSASLLSIRFFDQNDYFLTDSIWSRALKRRWHITQVFQSLWLIDGPLLQYYHQAFIKNSEASPDFNEPNWLTLISYPRRSSPHPDNQGKGKAVVLSE